MADAAVTCLVEQVSHLLKYHVNLISGAANEFRLLLDELPLLEAFLREAAKKPKKEMYIEEMERQIRKLVYDAEDTIDSCLTQAATRKSVFRRRITKPIRVEEEIRSLREELKLVKHKVKRELDKMPAGDGSSTNMEERRTKIRKDYSIRQDNVVGFNDEEENLINYLKEESEELDVISIVGMPGLGKTTLAWKLFHNPEIQYQFPIRIWVNVSHGFNRKDVLLNILKQFTNEDMSLLSEVDIDVTVRACLEGQKFMLVMDDLWSVDAWNSIRDVLPMNNGMGKVLITSRDTNVGRHANPTRPPHSLRFLTSHESWQLLQLEVFGDLEHCPQALEQIGKYIANQCYGLPLTIVVIGGVLLDQWSTRKETTHVKDAWEKVSRNVEKFVGNNRELRISDIVSLSYDILPHYLRDCFLYLGVFPEYYEIPVWTLTRLWIAEGFIRHKDGHSLEEIAEEYLNDLIDRNLVMVVRKNLNGRIKTCSLSGVIRAFCISKASIREKNLFQEIKMQHEGTFEPPISEVHMYRRLCIHSDISEFISRIPRGGNVRSFLCFQRVPSELSEKYAPVIPDSFQLLRVLDSKSFKFIRFPKGVTKLIHLRYITVSGDDLDSLPNSISELWNLQTIVVETNSLLLHIKANIWKMIQLRHLKSKAAIFLAIKGGANDDAGENLQRLSNLSPQSCTDDVFERAHNLKTLGIRGKLTTLSNTSFLKKLDRLEKLKLVNDLLHEPSKNPLQSLPEPNCFPPHLKTLTLSCTFLDWKHMSTLANIDSLEVLKLKDNAFTGKSWNAVGHGFLHLQVLLIEWTDLAFWEVSTDHFPHLRGLVLKNCEKLHEIPVSLAKESFQKLEIERLRRSAVLSARKIEEIKARWGGGFKLLVGSGCE